MKNLMKKKYAVLILAALLIMGSTKAFASGGPFANIIGLIRNAFSAKTETVIDDTAVKLLKSVRTVQRISKNILTVHILNSSPILKHTKMPSLQEEKRKWTIMSMNLKVSLIRL